MKRRTWAVLAGVASLGGVAAIVVLGLWQRKGPDWWAAWGQWVGGIGSLAAAGVALWIAHEGWARAEADRRDDEAAPARLVFTELFSNSGSFYVRIWNRHSAAIFDLRIVEMRSSGGEWSGDDRPIGGSLTNLLNAHDDYICGVDFKGRGEITTTAARMKARREAVITISFMDANGRRWTRTGNADPVRVTA